MAWRVFRPLGDFGAAAPQVRVLRRRHGVAGGSGGSQHALDCLRGIFFLLFPNRRETARIQGWEGLFQKIVCRANPHYTGKVAGFAPNVWRKKAWFVAWA